MRVELLPPAEKESAGQTTRYPFLSAGAISAYVPEVDSKSSLRPPSCFASLILRKHNDGGMDTEGFRYLFGALFADIHLCVFQEADIC